MNKFGREKKALWLVDSGGGSNSSRVVLFSTSILLLSALAYAKNRLLATSSEPDRRSARKEKFMSKTKTYFGVCIASILEVALTLGASHLAVVGPLAKAPSANH